MDLNYLLHREQVERARAEQSMPGNVADAHRGMADLYRQQINEYRQAEHKPEQPDAR